VAPLSAPDVIFHLAGQTSAYRARADLETDIRVNLLGFTQVLLAALETGAKPFVVVAGAATEVGLLNHPIVSDDNDDNPQTFYDVAKVAQGLYLRQFSRESWLHGCRVRFANVYGGVASGVSDRGFLNRAVKSALSGGSLTYFTDSTYIRDFLHVSDAASALMAAATSRELTGEESFMIGTGRGTPIRQALEIIAEVVSEFTGVIAPVIPAIPSEGMFEIERRDAVMDAGRFTSLTGWKSKITLETGIRAMVHDLTENSR
jgi:UDP-glucose 4-epimerase